MPSPRKTCRRASRTMRGQQAARIWQFEQLESRAMLAVMGPMPYYGGDHGPQLQSVSESFSFATFSPAPIEQHWAGESMEHGWGGRPMQGGFHDDRMMIREYADFDVWMVVPPNLAHSSLTQAPTQPVKVDPPSIVTNASVSGGNGHGLVGGSPGAGVQPNPTGAEHNSPSPIVQPNESLNPQTDNGRFRGFVDDTFFEAQLLALRNAASSILLQSTSREPDSAALAPTSALDAALQSYTSQLLLATSTTTGQLTNSMKSNDQPLPDSDSDDDFIRIGEVIAQDLFAVPTDANARQGADVEAVLNSLYDAGSLPIKLNGDEAANAVGAPQDQDAQIADLVFGGEFDLADGNGGMVLLKATGDANESPVNLASVAEAHPDLFSGHVGVEPSVGLYQAIDMGIEELSAIENMPAAKPSAQPSQQAKPDNHYSANASKAGSGTNSRKSAAAATVSALAGGLLWVASRIKSDEDDAEECSASQRVH